MHNTTEQPLASVCIPVRNCQDYIRDAIESVLNQTYRNVELVVVDDASTDKTVEVVQSFQDSRIRLFTNPRNVGVCANWNLAIAKAHGDYIKLLCADDVLYPGCLEKQVRLLHDDAERSIAVVCCPRDIIDSEGRVRLRSRGWPIEARARRIAGRNAVLQMARQGRNLIGEPLCVLFRKDAFTRAGGFDSAVQKEIPFCLDWDLWCRLLQTGDLFVTKETQGAFRVNPGSASLSMARRFAESDRTFIRRLRDNRLADLTHFDIAIGSLRSWRDACLRRIFYALLWLPD